MSVILTRTPFRMSFFGGGTDYPAWYLKEGGAVLSTTLDKYCYISCRWLPPFFEYRYRIVWSHIETVSTIPEILHPAVREGLRMLEFDREPEGIELHHQGDLPARTGMGSSSSFAVGLLKALNLMRGRQMGKHELALAAIELEQKRLGDAVGSQDQVAAAYGGFNKIVFNTDGTIDVHPVRASWQRLEALNDRLLLVYLGTSRISSQVASEVIRNIPKREAQLRDMRAMVDEALSILEDGRDLDDFGRLLHQTWLAKRSIAASISNERVDSVYEAAKKAGALGGKLLGAGSTGFIVFYVPNGRRQRVREALAPLLEVPFRFGRRGSFSASVDQASQLAGIG